MGIDRAWRIRIPLETTALDDAVLAIAAHNRRHPVREYLGALEWDGRDHIALLASFFTVKPTVDDAGREVPAEPITYDDGTQRTIFHAFLRRWLVGSVAKMHGDTNAARDNFILVLASDQGNGKSHFAHWLCPMPGYFVERHIVPDDKDCSLQRTRAWIWEVMEIGATTSKANTEALKAHITTAEVTERKAYGHFDTVKPAVASYIGTVNPDGAGFLNDRTGNRRFAVVELEGINWEYANVVDVRDVWAQAMALWRAEPTAYKLTDAEVERRDATAARHLAISAVEDALLHVYDIDPEQDAWRVKPAEIMGKLRMFGGLSGGSDNVVARDVARVLKNLGIEKKSYGPAKYYGGLRLKSEYATGIQ